MERSGEHALSVLQARTKGKKGKRVRTHKLEIRGIVITHVSLPIVESLAVCANNRLLRSSRFFSK